MRKMLLAAATAVALGAVGFVTAPASAAVGGPAPGIAGPTAVEKAQMTRRQRMQRQRMQRRRAMRRARVYGNPNARNPSRPGYQQQQGTTSGGPRY